MTPPAGFARWRAHAWTALLLVLALCVVYANVVFGGRSLVASDTYNPMRPPVDATSYGEGFVPDTAWRQRGLIPWAGFYDAGAAWWIWEPGAPFLLASLRQGSMPFWNPYVGAGVPGLANMSETHFFPPWLLVVLSGAGSTGKTYYLLALLFFAGFCTFLFLRRAGLGDVGAAAGALVFQLSGALNSVIISMGGQAVACIPFLAYVTRVFLDRPSAARMALLAVSYACVSLASSPPMLLLGFGFVALYALVAGLSEAPGAPAGSRVGVLLRYACSALLALGLVAWYYVPVAELIRLSTYVKALYSQAAEQTLPVVTLLQLITSDLGASWLYTLPVTRDPVPWHMHVLGVGAFFGLLLAGGGGKPRRRTLTLLCALVVLAMLAKVVGFAPLQWLARLPLVRSLHYAVYSSFLLHFPMAALAGVGFERLWRGELAPRRPLIAFALVAATLATLFVVAQQHGLELSWRAGVLQWLSRYATLWIFAALLAWAGWLLARRAGSPRARVFAAGLIAVALLAEGVHNLSFPRQRRVDVWRHPPPHVRALMDLGDGRRFAHYQALTANLNAAFGVFGLDSLQTFNPERLVELYQRHFKGPQQQFLREMQALPADPLLDRAGIGWLVVRTGATDWLDEARRRGYAQRYQDDWATIFRRPSGLRYLVTPDYRVLDAAQIRDEVTRASWLQVLLEEAPSFPARPFEHAADVKVAFFRNNAFALDVVTPGPAMLYCAESHMPGWTATVNGQTARLLRANYAFRALELPAGRSRVEFAYVPPGWREGLRVSALSVTLLALLLASALRRRRSVDAVAR